MTRIVLVVVSSLLPATAVAQSFSPAEASLISAVEACWNDATADLSMEPVTGTCGATEATTYWWTPETAPYKLLTPFVEGVRAAWNRSVVTQELRPIRVHIDGDYGFIYFHGLRIWQSSSGAQEAESWKGFEVWKRIGGAWSFLGGTGTPDAANQGD